MALGRTEQDIPEHGPRAHVADEDLLRPLDDPSVLASVLDFLANHERDLLAASAALDLPPEKIVAARNRLAPPADEM